MEVRLLPSLQLKGHKGENFCFFSLSLALFLFYCGSFHGMMHADPAVEWMMLINREMKRNRNLETVKVYYLIAWVPCIYEEYIDMICIVRSGSNMSKI